MIRHSFTLIVLSICLLGGTWVGCQGNGRWSAAEGDRLEAQLTRYFEQQQLSELMTMFVDSVSLQAPGGYHIEGKEVLLQHWRKYFLPMSFNWNTIQTSTTIQELKTSDNFPSTLAYLPEDSIGNEGEEYRYYQWAEWKIQYEGEDGVIRSETTQVVIGWVQRAESGWLIHRLYLG